MSTITAATVLGMEVWQVPVAVALGIGIMLGVQKLARKDVERRERNRRP